MVDENLTPGASRREPLSILWHILAAPQTLLLLLGLVALVVALGSLIPQATPDAANEGLVAALGLGDIYHSFWFRLLAICTGLVLFVRAADATSLAWRVTRPGGGLAWPARAPRLHLSSSLDLETARDRIHHSLSRHGYRWAELDTGPATTATACRRPALFWARPLGYAGLFVAALGLIILDGWGWRDDIWRPAPGESRSVGHGTPYVLRLESFDLEAGTDGRLQGHSSQVAWQQEGVTVHQGQVGVGDPATFEGVSVRSAGFVPLVTMQAWDSQGNPLPLDTGGQDLRIQTQVDVLFLRPEERPAVFMPGQDRFFLLAFEPGCGQAQPVLHVDLVGEAGAQRDRIGSLAGGGQLSAAGLRVDLAVSYVPLLRIDHRPGLALVVGGLALALIALAASWLAFPHLVWLVMQPRSEDELDIQLISQPEVRAQHKSAQIAGRLQGVLADDS
ncbi:MAG: cytochrome c biogenesis protein ResB [Anaerolineae bacterium]|nr:cytochrome c biogenesis protein ResB [Anaerolineae bacterium]